MTDLSNEERAELGRQVMALRAQIQAHPALAIIREWHIVTRACNIFIRNSNELAGVLVAARDSPHLAEELFQNVRPPEGREEYMAVVDQRLHNYVASVMSLVEHTRKMIRRRYPVGTDFQVRYQERVIATFAGSPMAMFVQDLRDYLLHNLLPLTVTQVTMSGLTPPTAAILLHVPRLREWKKWSPKARELLDSAGLHVRLLDAVEQYAQLVGEFYDWMFAEYPTLHAADLEPFEAIVQQEAQLWASMRADVRPPAVHPIPDHLKPKPPG